MEDVTVSFRFGPIGFERITDLTLEQEEKVQRHFSKWEKDVRKSAAIHSLNQELDVDTAKTINVTVEMNKESPTSSG